jgi:hypothetical protein
MTGVWTVEIYMETSGSLEQKGTPERSTSLVPGSPANHIVTPDRDLERVIPEISGPRHERSFGWWDASGSCLRTFQGSFLEMMDGNPTASKFWGIFPNWGLMLDGEFIALPTPDVRTSESGGGSWPTPTPWQQQESSESWTERRKRERAKGRNGNGFGIPLDMAVKMHHIPTPTTADVYTGNMKSSQQSDGSMHSVTLPDYVEMFPTPTATIRHNDVEATPSEQTLQKYEEGKIARIRKTRAPTLSTYIEKEHEIRWATPTARDHKVTGKNYDYHRSKPVSYGSGGRGIASADVAVQVFIEAQDMEGSLNPDWVEQHLMSLPEGWTRLEPVPDGAYQEWFDAMRDGTWWDTERGLPRVTTGVENRVNRLKMLGNGIVPATLALFLKGSKQ